MALEFHKMGSQTEVKTFTHSKITEISKGIKCVFSPEKPQHNLSCQAQTTTLVLFPYL